jgi:hypothetical protein
MTERQELSIEMVQLNDKIRECERTLVNTNHELGQHHRRLEAVQARITKLDAEWAANRKPIPTISPQSLARPVDGDGLES